MTSLPILQPGVRVTDANGNPVSGGKLKFFQAGTTTPLQVYSDADGLSTLGATVYTDDGGYPVVSSGSSTKTLVYSTAEELKVVITDSDDVTLATHDNVTGSVPTPVAVAAALPTTPVVSKSSDYVVTAGDRGKLLNVTPSGQSVEITLPSAIDVGDNWRLGVRHAGNSAYKVAVVATAGQTIAGPGQLAQPAVVLHGVGHTYWVASNGANYVVTDEVPQLVSGGIGTVVVAERRSTTPATPEIGARYIVTGSPSGAWATNAFAEHDLVEYVGNSKWIKYPLRDGLVARVANEQVTYAYNDTSDEWDAWSNVTAPTATQPARIIVSHTSTDGTGGGTATTGTWTKLPFATLVAASSGLTHNSAAATVTLEADDYRVRMRHSFYGAGNVQIRFRSMDTATALYSESVNTRAATNVESELVEYSTGVELEGEFAAIDGETFIAEYYCSHSSGTETLGVVSPNAVGAEQHGRLVVEKRGMPQGAQGEKGDRGDDGLDAAYSYQWSVATSGDPGAGRIRANHATPTSATQIAVSETDTYGATVAGMMASWDDSTSITSLATIKISREGATNNFVGYKITGAGTDQGTYWTFPVSAIGGDGALANLDYVAVGVYQVGDKGDPGTTVPDIGALAAFTPGVLDITNDKLAGFDTSTGATKSITPLMLADETSTIVKATTSADLATHVAAGRLVIIPDSVTELTLTAGQAITILPKLYRVDAVNQSFKFKLPSGYIDFPTGDICRFGPRNSNITIEGAAPVTTTLASVASVSGSVGNQTVVINVGSSTGMAVGDTLKIAANVSPIIPLGGDDIFTFRQRPQVGEISRPNGKLGYITFSAGGSSAAFSISTDVSNCIAVGDLIHANGDTRVVSSVTPPTIGITGTWSKALSASLDYYISRAETGTVSTGGVSSSTVTGTGTSFLSIATPNASQLFVNGGAHQITAIASDTSMTVVPAVTISALTAFTIITPGCAHAGGHVITAIAGNQVTVNNTSYDPLPVKRVGNAADVVVACLKTTLRNTGTGDGFVPSQGGNLKLVSGLCVMGNGVEDTEGLSIGGDYSQGKTQVSTSATITLDDCAVVRWWYGAFAGYGSTMQLYRTAVSGNTSFGVWTMEKCTVNARLASISGSGATGAQINAGGTIIPTASAIVGNNGDGIRIEPNGGLYGELPMLWGNTGMNIRTSGDNNFSEATLGCAGGSGARFENGSGSAIGMLLICNDRAGVEAVDWSDINIAGSHILGTTSLTGTGQAVYAEMSDVGASRCVLKGGSYGIHGDQSAEVNAPNLIIAGSAVALYADNGADLSCESAALGGGSATATGGNSRVYMKGYSGAGATLPATLNRADADGNVVDVGSDVSKIPSYPGLDLSGQGLSLSGDITPSQITADQENYSPSGLAGASIIRISTDADRYVGGLAGGADGRVALIINAGNNLARLIHEGSGSTTGNRFWFGGFDVLLEPGDTILLIYDSTLARWRPMSNYQGRDQLVAIIRDEKASGTAGGDLTGAAWTTRALSTITHNHNAAVTLSANQFAIGKPGRYRVDITAPAHRCGAHRAKLYSITGATDVALGSSHFSGSGASYATNDSTVSCVVDITAPTTYEVRHYVGTTRTADGGGIAVGAGTEVYTVVKIFRLFQ